MAETGLIVAYWAEWPAQFERAAAMLRDRIPHDAREAVAIEHIGSTAVPGLCAKPVLDVMLGVPTLPQAKALAPALASIGYRYRPEHEAQIPQRRYFVRDADDRLPRVHLHAVVRGEGLWQQHLAFRDRLRREAGLRVAYAELKLRLAAEHGRDKAAYTEAKAPFIGAVLAGGVPLGR